MLEENCNGYRLNQLPSFQTLVRHALSTMYLMVFSIGRTYYESFIKLTRGTGGYWYRKRFFNLITVGRATYELSMDCDINYLRTYGKLHLL